MKNDIRSSKKGNAAYLNVGVWYEAETGHIHITLPNSKWFHTTVNDKPSSKRAHHSLFTQLARAMKEAGILIPKSPRATMPTGPKGEKRPADVNVRAVLIAKIATRLRTRPRTTGN
jgi:hypothetical protein